MAMKIQLDFTNKVVKCEGQVNLKDFIQKVKKLLPDDWQEWNLETNTIIYNWSNPIIYTYPNRDITAPFISYCGTSGTLTTRENDIVSNFELN